MSTPLLFTVIVLLSQAAYWLGYKKAYRTAGEKGPAFLHSRPQYYGILTLLWGVIPPLLLLFVWFISSEAVLTNLALKSF